MTKTVEIKWYGNSAFVGKVRVAEMAYNMLEQCWSVRLGDCAGRSYMPESETRAWVEGWLGVGAGADKPGDPPAGYRAYLKSNPVRITDLPNNVRQALIDLNQCNTHILSKPDGTVVITVTPKAESAPEKPKPAIEWRECFAYVGAICKGYVHCIDDMWWGFAVETDGSLATDSPFSYLDDTNAKRWVEWVLGGRVECELESEAKSESPQPTKPQPLIEWINGEGFVDGVLRATLGKSSLVDPQTGEPREKPLVYAYATSGDGVRSKMVSCLDEPAAKRWCERMIVGED